MTNYNLYRVFYHVAKEKNLSKASEILYTSQPAVSFSIKELEKELNQKLFIRKSKGVELTSYGKILYNKVKNVIEELDDIEKSAERYNKLEEGSLRIGTSSSNINQIVLEYLTKFVNKYPNIQIVMQRGTKDKLIERLYNNDLDIIFVDKNDREKDFNLIKQFDIEYKLIGNKKYKEKYNSNNIELNKFPINELMLPSINNNSRITIDNFFGKEHIKLKPKYELDNYILLYEFVKKGFGMAFVNIEYYKDVIGKDNVSVIFPSLTICARKIICLTSKETSNKVLNKFVDIINE